MARTGQEEPERRSEQKIEKSNGHKFTRRACNVLQLAQEEAMHLQIHYIDTEHLLLGLVNEIEGVVPLTPYVGPALDGEDLAGKIFSNLGVELHKVHAVVEHIVTRRKRVVPNEIGLTPHTKKAIELTVYEVRRLNHQYIGTGHLLLGLLREDKGIAAVALKKLGINLKKARTQTAQLLSKAGSPNV